MRSGSLTTTKRKTPTARPLPPIHPGVVLSKELLKPLELSQYRLAKGLSVSTRRISEIVLGRRAINANTALRLARFFSTSERFWLNLQATYDLETERDRFAKTSRAGSRSSEACFVNPKL